MTALNFVEEHLNSYNSPYKFNAKELDEETGNYYYGARYYNPKWSLWLSVDPMYHLYPSVSPYTYTLNNPVRYTDPTGMVVEDHDDWYRNLLTNNIEYFEGSRERDGYENLGASTNLVISNHNNHESYSLNEDGSFTNIDSGRHYNKGKSLTANNGTEIKSNLTLGEKASRLGSDIVAPFVEVPQDIGTGIINQMDRGLMLLATGEDKADTNNYLIKNTYNFENWNFTKGRNTYSTGRPTWEEGKRKINNTIDIFPLRINTGKGLIIDNIIESLIKEPVKQSINQVNK